jgi:metallo-beta-lactamase family protein
VVRATAERGGKLVIPAFAVGRVEELLYWIGRLEEQQRIPVLPVFVDSPMAMEALARYTERLNELDPELQPETRDDKAPHDAAAHEPVPKRQAQAARERRLCAFCTTRLRIIASSAESKQLTQSRMPAIVISSSGMATGGRVLHHLKDALPNPRNTVLLVGFQAEGTRGRQLLDGASSVKIHGQDVPVQAVVGRIESMSAHADSSEILRWLGGFQAPPKRAFLVHGEPAAMDTLAASVRQKLGWNLHTPHRGEVVTLES